MKNSTNYSVAIYCRLSKDDNNDGESSSITTQKSIIRSFCLQQGYTIFDYYVDDGFSGTNFCRPDFERMLNDINEGKINMVITKDLSRLGRDYLQTGYYTEIFFVRKNIRYIAVNDGFDSAKENNDIAPFKNLLNDMYARDISRKIKTAKMQRLKQGNPACSIAPYGYRLITNGKFVIDDSAAKIVKRIFEAYARGLGGVSIAKELEQEQIPSPSFQKYLNGDTRFWRESEATLKSPNKWCSETINQIVHNRTYLGEYIGHKTEIVNYKTKEQKIIEKENQIIIPQHHEAIITEELFAAAEKAISLHFSPRNSFCENIFRGMIRCGTCGSSMGMCNKSNGYTVFRCLYSHYHPTEKRHTCSIHYDDVSHMVLKKIQSTEKLFNSDSRTTLSRQLTEELINRYIEKIVIKEKRRANQSAESRVVVFLKIK